MPHGFKLTLLSAAISASTGAQTTLPHNAIAYVPALSTITPDRESAQLGQQRTIRQGETIFSFDVQAPPSAMLLGAVDVNEDGQTIRLESGIHLEPFEITGISEGSLPSQIYCSKNGSAASTFAGRALSNSGARQSRICLADVDSNGTFDHVLLDAVFPKGVISPLARNLKSIEPIKYEIEGQRKRLLLGRYSIYFRGFPFPSNKFTVAMRLDGTKKFSPKW